MRSALKSLFRRSSPASPEGLTDAGLLASDLWLDRPDAARRIEAARSRGRVDAAQAEALSGFAERGYLTFPIDLSPETAAALDREVERLWREKPADVAYAYHSILKPFAYADDAERRPSYRIADLHSSSPEALGLYLHRRIFDWVELILGQEAVATQSLYFEFGSQQSLHRDPVFVQTQPPSHLVAAWIALEDIDPASGPLVYVPGSHRLPYYQFEPGEHRFDHRRHGEGEIHAMAEFDARQVLEAGLPTESFTPRRGEVLIWHHSLLHGGSAPQDPALTRKSFVVHFSTRSHYRRLKQTYLRRISSPDGFIERPQIAETEEVLERDGCAGFASPLSS